MNNDTQRSILITGGAGYVGSHAVLAFRETGENVVVIDDLSTGRRDAVPADVPFIEGDIGDPDLVRAAKEVLDGVERVTGRKIDARPAPRRAGDSPTLVADSTAIQRNLGWRPRHDKLDHIIETAINWERSLHER